MDALRLCSQGKAKNGGEGADRDVAAGVIAMTAIIAAAPSVLIAPVTTVRPAIERALVTISVARARRIGHGDDAGEAQGRNGDAVDEKFHGHAGYRPFGRSPSHRRTDEPVTVFVPGFRGAPLNGV